MEFTKCNGFSKDAFSRIIMNIFSHYFAILILIYKVVKVLMMVKFVEPTEGICSMVVPAMSTRPRTSALRMPSTKTY